MRTFYLPFFNFDEKKLDNIINYCKNNSIGKVIVECVECEYDLEINSDNPEFLEKISVKAVDIVQYRLNKNTQKYLTAFINSGFDVILHPPEIEDEIQKIMESEWRVKYILLSLLNGIILLFIGIPVDFILDKLGKKDLGERVMRLLTFSPLKNIMKREEESKEANLLNFAMKIERDSGLRVVLILQEKIM